MTDKLFHIAYHPIGTIHSPFKEPKGTPIQPVAAQGVAGTVEVLADYGEGLKDLEGFSHIVLLYHFHLSRDYKLLVTPFLDDVPRGLFATRAPKRPNPIGLSVVRLVSVEGNILHIRNVDIVDGTPLLDIKPFVPYFEPQDGVRFGWLEGKSDVAASRRADQRFVT